MKKPKVVLLIDGPDPDNYLALMAAISRFMCYELVAVIMTGRPVSSIMSDKAYMFNPRASRAVRRDNSLHAKGILMRHGGERVPVFTGGMATYSTIEHKFHIHERVTDIFDDAHAGHVLAGDINDAIVHLSKFDEPIHVICGGPLTDLVPLITHPMLFGKLGIVVAQLGMFGFNPDVKTHSGKRRQFNVLADPLAVEMVMRLCRLPFYLVSTDVTKHAELAFDSAAEFAALSSSKAGIELFKMYVGAWPHMWGPLGVPAHTHDFHPTELMHYLLQGDPLRHLDMSAADVAQEGRYTLSPVGISRVAHLPEELDDWGEMDLGPMVAGRPRFLVKSCDNSQHRPILSAVLDSIGTRSEVAIPV